MNPVQLFTKISEARGENVLTEALALALQSSPQFRVRFLKKAGVRVHAQENIEFVPQRRDARSGKIPDLTIKSSGTDRFFLLFEIKEHYELSLKQWKSYEAIAQEQPFRVAKAFAIVTPYTKTKELEVKVAYSRIWKWTDVYEIIEASLQKETSQIAQFLLSEMLALMEIKRMKPFKSLSPKEISSLQHFSEATRGMSALLDACFSNLQQSSDWKIHTGGKFRWEASNDVDWFDKIWGGISKTVTRDKVTLGIWVGCYCCPEGVEFCMSIWKGRTLTKDAFERAAIKAKLEKEGDYFSLQLITPTDSSPALPQELAKEVQNFLNRVFRELPTHGSRTRNRIAH